MARATAAVPPPHIAGAARAPRLQREHTKHAALPELVLSDSAITRLLPRICAEPGPALWRSLDEDGAVIWRREGVAAANAPALDDAAVANLARTALAGRLSAASLPVQLEAAKSGSTDPNAPDTMPAATKDTPHADGQKSYLNQRPDVFMLVCERPATSGGENYIIDAAALAEHLVSVHLDSSTVVQRTAMNQRASTFGVSAARHLSLLRQCMGAGHDTRVGVDRACFVHNAGAPTFQWDRGGNC